MTSENSATPKKRGAPARRRRRSALLDRVDTFLKDVRPQASEQSATQYVRELVVTAVRLLDDQTPLADVRLLNAAVRELRTAFRVFAQYRDVRKVTTFGSARTPLNAPEYVQAKRFSQRIANEGFMVITGAGGGIMRACQEGAGRERTFGVNIRLPFEQKANDFIADDPKLVAFKYFFTRKLLFVKEADAVVLFPGGFGTLDEGYELLTLVQTGKAAPVPIIFLDAPGGDYWSMWRDAILERLFHNGLISAEDFSLFKITDDVEEAVAEILLFYRIFNSSRFVGERFVIRLNRSPSTEVLARLHEDFGDLPVKGGFDVTGKLPEEEADETAALPRLVFHFNRVNYGRLRQLIDFLNRSVP